ncbi:hypothetical protein CERSUDRAFT_80516 [Gelatoporia subvermispora B]|uniref:Uncharacterized protein n=1 Tax=Ceriporiopsis subvermispora (strain B) TaxID=914234 RepID=M2PVS1_CERS8|nr:hypothetical protein CERSUDRAFT_80516 [Gelatoporia subvermispora B]
MDKLERLEAESLHADQAGKRKLRKLEKEIQGLRHELESTQAKSEELEAQAKTALDMSPLGIQRRREEREERIRRIKKAASSDPDNSSEVKDFAPASELSRSTPLKNYSPASVHTSSSSSEGSTATATDDAATSLDLPKETETDEDFDDGDAAPLGRAFSQPEMAIISQLLLKVQELEETNAQIKAEQRMTDERLRAAQWDAESIRRVYDCLDDLGDEELEVIPDSGVVANTSDLAVGGDMYMRLSHLRQSLDNLSLPYEDDRDVFGSGITKDMQSTTRSAKDTHPGPPPRRARKPVMGLFDSPEPDTFDLSTPDSSFQSSSRALSPSDLGDTSGWSVAATDGITASSPALSTTPTDSPAFTLRRSLGSELGSEFGDDWNTSAGYQHLRTSSLYDLAQLNFARDGSASPDERPAFVFPAPDSPSPAPAHDAGSASGRTGGSSTPTRSRAPTLKVEPPTPSPEKLRAQTRSRRLSQTMRARTHRWIEGRFPQEEMKETKAPRQRRTASRRGTDAGGVMDDAFGEVVQHVRSFSSRGALSLAALSAAGSEELGPDASVSVAGHTEDGTVRATHPTELQPAADATIAGKPHSKRDGLVGIMLEVWLWLQFAIVILVFLWAMAKRGPKSVLQEAERRAQQGSTVRRT